MKSVDDSRADKMCGYLKYHRQKTAIAKTSTITHFQFSFTKPFAFMPLYKRFLLSLQRYASFFIWPNNNKKKVPHRRDAAPLNTKTMCLITKLL